MAATEKAMLLETIVSNQKMLEYSSNVKPDFLVVQVLINNPYIDYP